MVGVRRHVAVAVGVLLVGALITGCNESPPDADTPPPSKQEPASGPDASAVLLEAAFAGRTELVREALSRGGDANAKGADGRTGLMLAAFDGHTETLAALLDAGARVDERDPFGRTALMYAASGPNEASVSLLLAHDADPNLVDSEERFTALMYAAAEGQAANVRLLLEHGADASLVDADGETALDFATQKGHGEVARILTGGGS